MDMVAFEHLGFEIALGTYLLASILFVLYVSIKKRRLGAMGVALVFFGFVFQTFALIDRWFYAGHPPWVSTYEVMSFFAWTIVGAYLVLNIKSDYKSVGVLVAPLAFILLGFASMQPTNPTPLIPALQSIWLLIHVPIVILSYCAFVVAFAASALYLLKDDEVSAESNKPKHVERVSEKTQGGQAQKEATILDRFRLEELDELAYKSVAIGFPLLTIGIITGAIWANSAWGSYWSWDPKETWSLITWFVFVIYLHARTQNWNARFAAYISVAGFLSVICTFLGVGYVLPFMETYLGVSAGLHSYAGGDAVAGTVFFCGILGAVLLLLFVTRRRPPSADAAPSAHTAVNGS